MNIRSKYFADKTFYKQLFVIITPIILQFFIQNFINLLDNIMVGQLGEEEIAAVGSANQYYRLFYPTIVSICTGASIYTSQFFGSNKIKELQKIFGFKLFFPMLVTILFLVVGFIFPQHIIGVFNKEGNPLVQALGEDYLKIVLWSYVPLTISTAFTFTLRPLKLTHLPMVSSSIGMLVNLVLNYCLIYGNFFFPRLGVKGAAIATVIARVVELFIYIIVYYKKDLVFKTKFKNYFILDFSLINNTLRKVFPLFINEFANSFALVLIFQIFSLSGKSAVSAITITDVVSQMVFIFANGLGTATSILVGYKLGQNDLDGAEENANYLLGYSLIVGIVILVVLSIAGFVVPQFYNISGYTRQVTTYTILIQALFAPMLILTRIFFFILRSGGRVREVVLINGLFMWVVKVPLAVILGFVFKVDIIILFFAVEATRVLNTLICIYYYKQKKWRINLTLESKNSSRG